jgi:hypothetical protein
MVAFRMGPLGIVGWQSFRGQTESFRVSDRDPQTLDMGMPVAYCGPAAHNPVRLPFCPPKGYIVSDP